MGSDSEKIPVTSFEDNEAQWIEVANLSDYISSYGSGASLYDIKLTDLYRYLRNPYNNIQSVRNASKYLTNKHGVVKDILRTFKSLPTLNYHLNWSSYDDAKKIKKYEKKIHDFLEEIRVKKMVRDGLYEVGEVGTIVTCLRNNKYVQFLEMDDLRIIRQVNGKWVVEYDLSRIDKMGKNAHDKTRIIESLPDEVTLYAYNLYKNKGDDYRYVELSNCDVVNIDSNRNFPYGLPLSFGAWSSLIQKELINRVERSVADRLIKQVLILYAGNIDGKNGTKPAPKPLIQGYFKEISNLMQKKEQGGINSSNAENSGTGVIALPDFFELKTLDIDVTMFKKELYEKINNDIFMNLGVSSSLIYGGGDSNFSSAQVNSEKLFRYIFTVLEDFEYIINQYIKKMLPNDLSCKFYFSKTTTIDKDKHIDKCREFYQQTGIIQPWAEELLGAPYHYALGQAKYEKQVLKTESVIYPPINAHTSSGQDNQGGRPSVDDEGESTVKSKTNGGNESPSPSD